MESFSRREALRRAGALAALAALDASAPETALAAREPAVRRFRSRPDLRPSAVSIAGSGGSSGLLFLTPIAFAGSQAGPLIVGANGEPIWFYPLARGVSATCFETAAYAGAPVLSWWQGTAYPSGYGEGEGVVLDDSYTELLRVQAANGRQVDAHEFQITPEGTALFTCFPEAVSADLSSVGGPSTARVLDAIVQEIDLRTGELLLEWHSLEHIPVSESYVPPAATYDYLHVNSVAVAPDGNLLISGRYSWTIYKLDRRRGEVIWRLGGKHSDFALDPAARFAWQHDARQVTDGTLTVFDNGADQNRKTQPQSRALVLNVDQARHRVTLARVYRHPRALVTRSMGSVQLLPGGDVCVGWGTQPYASEFAAGGRLRSEASLPPGQQSYRAARLPWSGRPVDRPALALNRRKQTLYVSWNGATDVARWQLQIGREPNALRALRAVKRSGFETAIPVAGQIGYAAVAALDAAGRRLATSAALRL